MSEAEYTPLPVSPETDHSSENEKYHTFINLALGLAAITGIELVLVYIPLHPVFITTTLVVLSVFKFVAVIAWFMHLIYDKLLLTLVFGAGFAIALGTVIALLCLSDPAHVDFDAITGF